MELNNNEPNSTNEYKGWYDQILTITKEHNYDLYKKLNINDNEIQNLPNENDRISMLLCKRSLPIIVKNLFEIEDSEGKYKTEKGIATLTRTIKESTSNPLVFIAKLAQDSYRDGVNPNVVMENLMPRDFIEKQNNNEFNETLRTITKRRAPDLNKIYMNTNKMTRIQNNIASLHFK